MSTYSEKIGSNVDKAMRTLNIIYHDTSSLLNRQHIKKWLTDIEQNVTKIKPDFIILKACSRYLLFELNRKEWCKYYFSSIPYTPTPQPNTPTRSHLVLSRYPLTRNDSFGEPLIHIVDTTIAFNDIPMRYEYEDQSVQSIDIEKLTFIITHDSDSTNQSQQHITDFQSILQHICQHPHTIVLFGISRKSSLRPQDWEECSDIIIENDDLNKTQSVCYLSDGWRFESINQRQGHIQFKLVEFE